MSGYDLHTHSTCSDGTDSITENVKLALDRELTGIAITDHDTTDGYDEAVRGRRGHRPRDRARHRVLGRVPGRQPPRARVLDRPRGRGAPAELKRLTDTRFRRGEMMIEKLQELGYEISFERVQEIAGGGLIARPHVAKAMVEAGIVPLRRRPSTASSATTDRVRPEARARPGAVGRADRGGGRRLRAGPPRHVEGPGLGPDVLIEEMASAGMVGLEVDHPDHDEEQRAYYHALAARLDLVPTGRATATGERYGYRMGCDTTDAERYAELKRRAGQ